MRNEICLSYVTNSISEHELEKELKQGKFEEHFVGISIQVPDCRFLLRFDPCISLWSSLDLTIATDSLVVFQNIFLVSCPVSWGPSHASFWCPLKRATWLTWSSQDCKGATFLHESFSKSCRLFSPGRCNWGTAKYLIGDCWSVVCSSHYNFDNRPMNICSFLSFLSHCLELSPSWPLSLPTI